MRLDLSVDTGRKGWDVVKILKNPEVFLVIGGFPIQLSWSQWANLKDEVEREAKAEKRAAAKYEGADGGGRR